MFGVRLAEGLGVEVGLDLAGGGVARAIVAAEAAETSMALLTGVPSRPKATCEERRGRENVNAAGVDGLGADAPGERGGVGERRR